jgi:hypothetical protein
MLENENLNEPHKPQLNIGAVSSRLILEAILNDKQLQQLHAKRAEIYSLASPTVILGKDGKAETVWIDETNHPLLPKINEMIEQRTEQIKQWFQ